MKLISICILLVLGTVLLTPFHAGAGSDPYAKEALAIDRQSRETLNIGLNSLRWLLGASPDSYLHHASLVQEKQIDAIEALEKNGYARLELVDKMLGGTHDTFLRIIPTAKGQDIINTLAR